MIVTTSESIPGKEIYNIIWWGKRGRLSSFIFQSTTANKRNSRKKK